MYGGGGSKNNGTITDVLDSRMDNGYQFRDITYTDAVDIYHPDVKNNQFATKGLMINDRGVNGVHRGYSQLYDGVSEITQLHRTDNLYL